MMSVSKLLQFMDKKDLECTICLNRFHQPKTLKCMHTYCLQCIQKWVETHGKMICPACGHEHDLTKEDIQILASNIMITQLLEYVMKTEDQKPTKCVFCDNQPAHHCSTCQFYLCGAQCVKQHKTLPYTKDHLLYTLDMKKLDGSSDNETKCPADSKTTQEFYCSSCNKLASTQCQRQQHKVIPLSNARDEFNKDATKVVKLANKIENKLTEKLKQIAKYKSEFDSQLKLCRIDIENHEKNLIKTVQEKSKALISDLEEIHKESKVEIDCQLEDIDSKLTEVNNLKTSINTMIIKAMINKPEEQESLGSYWATVNTAREDFLGKDFNSSFNSKRNSIPNFTPSAHVEELEKGGIGRVSTVDSMKYKVAVSEEMTVITGQPFVVKISSPKKSDAHQLAATLKNSSGEDSATKVDYQGGREYKITSQCNVEGEWQMKITVGAAHINGSPVNIKVKRPVGLVNTICNISDYKQHNQTSSVSDVVLDRDGCILVSSFCKDILKFNQSGLFVARIQVPQDVKVNSMYQLNDGHILYSDALGKCVVMCNDNFQEVQTFGKGILNDPCGLAGNIETGTLYVADYRGFVFKFNIDDGSLMGKIGSEFGTEGHLHRPTDVILTKENYVIVSDYGHHKIRMFNANGNWMIDLVSDGIWYPCGLTMDMAENIIVSSKNELQLFDKNGVFKKRIDHEDDELKTPYGITVISDIPKRVVVANHGANNVKIFYY